MEQMSGQANVACPDMLRQAAVERERKSGRERPSRGEMERMSQRLTLTASAFSKKRALKTGRVDETKRDCT